MLVELVLSGCKYNTDSIPSTEELTACLIFQNFINEKGKFIYWIKVQGLLTQLVNN